MNITSFRIIDSTLREGEQFALAHFTVEQKLVIAEALDRFGVDYIELTSPVASPSSEADLRRIAMTERSFRLRRRGVAAACVADGRVAHPLFSATAGAGTWVR